MQSNQPGPMNEDSDHLPVEGGERRGAALTIARNSQALSLDLQLPDAQEAEGETDLLDYWRILVKRRWTVVATMAMVLVIALVNTLLTTPIYQATAVLQIDNESQSIVPMQGVDPGAANYDYDNSFLNTQLQLLQSRALAQRVVSQLGLDESGELEHLWPPSTWSKLRSILAGKSGSSADNKRPTAGKPTSDAELANLAAELRGGIAVARVQDSRLVQVSYNSPSPEFSQRVANALSEAFIASSLEHRFGSTSYAKNYLEDRLQELKLRLEDSERKLVAFAEKEQIVGSTDDSAGNLSQANLGSLNSAYGQARQARIQAEVRWRQVQGLRGSGLQAIAGGNSNLMMSKLQETRANLMAEYQDKLSLYKPGYPLMQQLKSQIDEVNKQITTEEGNIRAGVRAEYEAALQQEQMLGEQLSGLKGEVLDLQGRSIQYNILKRDVDTNRQLYDALLQRYKEIGVAGGVTANNIAVIDRAELGHQVYPSMNGNLIKAAMVGLMLGVLLALAFEYLDDTFKRPDDIEKQLGLPVLGAIPMLRAPMTPLRALEDVRSAFSESYRSLRTALQFSTDRGVPRSLLITSAMPIEGKSTTALVLAMYYAQLGKRVLIIDGDLRNPTLHRSLNVDNSQGLSNYLSGSVRPTEMIRPTEIPGLMYMPTGPLPPNPAELLMGPKMVSLLTVAAEKFDLLIIDGPPVMGLADAPILSNMAQGTLLVVRANQNRISVVRNALKRLRSARAHVVGALLTHFQPEHAGQGYGYGYGGYTYYSYGNDNPKLTRQ